MCSNICNNLGYKAFWFWTYGCYCTTSTNPIKTTNDLNHKVCNVTCIKNCVSSSCEYCGNNIASYASVYIISIFINFCFIFTFNFLKYLDPLVTTATTTTPKSLITTAKTTIKSIG